MPSQPFRLYPRRDEPTLDPDLFFNPTSAYRGTPFWCWNDRLDRAQLVRQIDVIQRMGFGGFHIHSRTGLATEYLGPTWMNLVRMCADEAERRKMLCWLYDEDRWPSGNAGGLATKDVQFRQRHLLWTRIPYGQNAPRGKSDYTAAVRNETGRLIARYDVELDMNFRLARYRRLRENEPSSAERVIWHAYIEPATPSSWFNGQTAVDTFSRQAMQKFTEATHERYWQSLNVPGDSSCPGAGTPDPRESQAQTPDVTSLFGSVIPAFFTDEPQFVKKSMFARGDEQHDLFMPISEDFFDTFRAAFSQELLDQLPELFWNLKHDAPSPARYRYHEHTAERFASAFSDTLGEWCERHGVALTGHMLGEGSLMSQTRGCGEAMRGLRSFHLPGIDILSDKLELTTALQARSVAHQFGREGVASELYGVTGWHFDFVGHKAQGDWQAALGVTVRVPHLFWMSMRGEAKRDYPASIGEQSPWFEEYKLVEDHFARIATIMTRGKPATRIAVIHPIESAWLHWGPKAQNEGDVTRLEKAFQQLPEWLLFGTVDFDYVSESILCNEAQTSRSSDRAAFTVGQMDYDCVIVPPTNTLRSTTLDALDQFADAGGTVIFAGQIATCVEAVSSTRAAALASRSATLPFERDALLNALARFRDLTITDIDGTPSDSILHQLRLDGDARHLLLVNTDRLRLRQLNVEIQGRWNISLLDTIAGSSSPVSRTLKSDRTVVEHDIPAHGHLLLTLTPATQSEIEVVEPMKWQPRGVLADPVRITLSEPNVLLLDRPRLLADDGSYMSDLTDVLVIDNLVRTRLNLPLRNGRGVQPWADREPAPVLSQVTLAFDVESDIDLPASELAMENPEDATIHFDGKLISNVPIGWWVDQAISRVAMPTMRAGRHELRLMVPFTRKTELEAIYLLGDFGVRVTGSRTRIIEPVRTLTWGDWATQGLPFYGGNVIYHAIVTPIASALKLHFPSFSNPLLTVAADSRRLGPVAFAPFEIELPPGASAIDITAFGNRANTFGPLHHADENLRWIGPNAWRSTGEAWRDEYALKRMGILSAPLVYGES